MCTRHIYANWRKKHREDDFQKPFWMCAKASSIPFFNFCRAKLAQLTPAGAKDMMSTNPKHWSRAWFNIGSNCDSMDNMCESFNNWIVDVRAHPIISMLEGIRTKVCPNILKKLNKYIDLAQHCSAIWNGKNGYEVRQKDKRYIVDIDKRTCSCRYWQLAGIPCAHAITALFMSSKPAEEYIADCYSIEEYNKIYDHCLMPMEGMDQWPTDPRKPQPPAYVKMPGRSRKERRRELGEAKKATKVSRIGTKIKCSKCKSTSHNSRTYGPKSNAKRRIFEAGKEASTCLSFELLEQFSYANILITCCYVQVLECSRPHKKARTTRGTERSIPGDATDIARAKTSSTSKACSTGKKASSTSKASTRK